MFVRKLLAVGAVVAGLLLPAKAMAQYEAITDADLNLRVGPGIEYGIIDVIPYGEVVDVFGCLETVDWCDVEWYGLRGWVSAYYLVQPGTTLFLPQVAPRLALPIVVFSFHVYHDRHYHDRPWYKKRHGRWHGRDWRHDRRHRDRHFDDRDRERHDAERPRRDKRIERSRTRERIERHRQRQETLAPRDQRREIKRSRQQRRDIERAREQRHEIERPSQRQESRRSSQQRREIKRARQRSEQHSQQSGKGQRSKRQRRVEERIESHRGQ